MFVNSKLGCARLARSLEREGLKTTALHGDKSQDERRKALDAFKKGEVNLLVCTDPFFDQPYEAVSAPDAQAAWDAAAKAAPVRSSGSANIKPKKKVAALFKIGG